MMPIKIKSEVRSLLLVSAVIEPADSEGSISLIHEYLSTETRHKSIRPRQYVNSKTILTMLFMLSPNQSAESLPVIGNKVTIRRISLNFFQRRDKPPVVTCADNPDIFHA